MKRSVPNYFTAARTWLLLLCMTAGVSLFGQTIEFGKSYINITKGLNGGTIETGDTLEIRASFVVRSGTYDSCRFQDVVPTGTTYIPGTIRVLTNEGKVYKQFTDGWGDDQGWISGSNVSINLGYRTGASPSTAFRRGRVANTHKPSFYGSTCIMIASYQVVITAATGTTISTGGGNMTYKSGSSAIQTYTFPNNTLMVYPNYGICSNTVGTNAIGTEFNGTFGSGQPRNRGTSGNVPTGYTYNFFDLNSPQDYYYGIANNTSTRSNYTTSNAWAFPDNSSPTHRVFTVWDIIGDHTGAANQFTGNPAADTVANPNGGYMLVINAAYRIDSAFQQTIAGLCPNTYYEISCWMRNICSKCGCDSNGKGATNSSGPPYYIPTGTGDSSGVAPNLTFEIDGIDYYTTGNLMHTDLWEKKGFTFLTGPSQTSFTLKFFNNAPGGGGNDWALDDISVSTCSPNMTYSPSLTPTVCDSNMLTIYDTVRSFFNNYTYYKWQRSTDGGSTWTDVTVAAGPATPVWNGTAWQYVTSYTIPPSLTQMSNAGDLYRVVVATTVSNITDPNCNFTDVSNIITLNVIDCGIPLLTQLISFTGALQHEQAALRWVTTGEDEPLIFHVEKSTDGQQFFEAGTVQSHRDYSGAEQQYTFTDPVPVTGKTWYRIAIRNNSGRTVYSRILILSLVPQELNFYYVSNPVSQSLQAGISSGSHCKAVAELLNATGTVVLKKQLELFSGNNLVEIGQTNTLAPGMYVLRVSAEGKTVQKPVIKMNR